MKKIFFYFFTFYAAGSFAQTGSKEACYTMERADTLWNLSCPSITQPSFPGGDSSLIQYLHKNITYPKLSKQLKLQGKVFITFVIDKQGKTTNVELYKGINVPGSVEGKEIEKKEKEKYKEAANQIDEEAIRVVQGMPSWSPGYLAGKPVKVRYILPFNFRLH